LRDGTGPLKSKKVLDLLFESVYASAGSSAVMDEVKRGARGRIRVAFGGVVASTSWTKDAFLAESSTSEAYQQA
jgi:hypothetical protein